MKKYNFTAGPSILGHDIVLKTIDMIDNEDKLSFLEISHRSNKIGHLFSESQHLVRDLMNLSDEYEVLFLHGGASLQNVMIPMNIAIHKNANYVDTGLWSTKSIKESTILRPTTVVASSSDKSYTYIPKILDWHGDGYLHITTNNTVSGTQYHDFDFCNQGVVVADMSSDILSREMDYSKFDLIYAGLQKNLGTAGGALVVIKKELIEKLPNIPSMLSYDKHVRANSILNTPPVFSVLVSSLVLKWIKQIGIDVIGKRNKQKADLLYETIDNSCILEGFVERKHRSLMNVTFDLIDKKLTDDFDVYLKEKGIVGLKGHRSKGGYRASLYNMMPFEHVSYLVECLINFERSI